MVDESEPKPKPEPSWITWLPNPSFNLLVGPCGCTVDNNYDGMIAAREHRHEKKPDGWELL